MDEFQRLASFARPDENDEWEEKIEKMLWSPLQTRLFSKVVKIFNSERLARLAKASTPMEPIFRRTSIDTAARRFREALACTGWDWRFTQWLHNLLFDALPQEYLSIYLDILQTLRIKIPQLIDKMIAGQPNLNAKTGVIPWENLSMLLKKTWDPVAPTLNASKPVSFLLFKHKQYRVLTDFIIKYLSCFAEKTARKPDINSGTIRHW